MANRLKNQRILDPMDYEKATFEHGLRFERPHFSFDTTTWESIAVSRLSDTSKGYLAGNAGAGTTNERNVAAFKRWAIVPSRMKISMKDERGSERLPDLSTTVFGQKLPWPIAIAPVGVQKIFNPDGESATASAAAETGVPFILSTASSTSIEEAAAANNSGPRWYQLYWPQRQNNDITLSILSRAKAAGYTALFVTLDTYVHGWRPGDMDNGYNPLLRADRIGVEIGFSDAVFQEHFKKLHGANIFDKKTTDETWEGVAAAEWTKVVLPGHSHAWEDLEFLKQNWEGPIVLKGIQTVADARKAVEAGVQGIVVSNHGGRQQDGGPGSLTMLPAIVDAVGGQIDVLFDSGVRCGMDIAIALALGAKCVLVGRPVIYGLTMGGKAGVRHVLQALCGDLELNAHQSGVRNREELCREVLIKDKNP